MVELTRVHETEPGMTLHPAPPTSPIRHENLQGLVAIKRHLTSWAGVAPAMRLHHANLTALRARNSGNSCAARCSALLNGPAWDRR